MVSQDPQRTNADILIAIAGGGLLGGGLALKAFRQALLQERDKRGRRLSRPYINRSCRWVRACIRWGVGEELVDAEVLHALSAVDALKRGRTDAPEPEPVRPVPDAVVDATLPALPPVVAQMVRPPSRAA